MELDPVFVNIIAIIAIIGGLAITGWWVFAQFNAHSRKKEEGLPEIKLPADLREVITGVPLALTVFYIFVFVTMIIYVLYIWLGGVTY
jgi:hypothetical protein